VKRVSWAASVHVLAEQAGAADAVGADEGGRVLVEFRAEQPDHDQLAGELPEVVHWFDSSCFSLSS
jgi:hypothetical protein